MAINLIRLTYAIALLSMGCAVFACSCMLSGPKSAFHGAQAVFIGEVISIPDSGPIKMRVIENFKGAAQPTIDVYVGYLSECDYGFKVAPGTSHLIYAVAGWTERNELGVLGCSRSIPNPSPDYCDVRFLRSRAWWWRTFLSTFRPLQWLRIRWKACP